MIEYSKKVYEYFQNPINAGIIENADGIGEIGDPDCGDFMRVYIKIQDSIVRDVKYQIKGCPASIACACAMTDIAIGQDIEDALMIDEQDILNAIDGLPEYKQHCSNLGAAALRKAIMDYLNKI